MVISVASKYLHEVKPMFTCLKFLCRPQQWLAQEMYWTYVFGFGPGIFQGIKPTVRDRWWKKKNNNNIFPLRHRDLEEWHGLLKLSMWLMFSRLIENTTNNQNYLCNCRSYSSDNRVSFCTKCCQDVTWEKRSFVKTSVSETLILPTQCPCNCNTLHNGSRTTFVAIWDDYAWKFFHLTILQG